MMPAWKCRGCGANVTIPEDPDQHMPGCSNMRTLNQKIKAAGLAAASQQSLALHASSLESEEKERGLAAKEESIEREGICPQCNKPIQQCKCNQTEVEVEAGQEEELGTKDSGFSNGGPFSCMNCIHRTPHSYDKDKKIVDSCKHPKVVNDKELESRKLPDDTIQVDKDDCCRYVRPESKK